jgi:hypothetical protein
MEKKHLKNISPLSHSKTTSFVNCQRKFSFSYLEGIKEPSSIHAAVGIFVHSVIEEYFKNESNKNPYYNWTSSHNFLSQTYEQKWKTHSKKLSFLYHQQKSKVNNSFESIEEWTQQLLLNYIELEDWIQTKSNIEALKFPPDAKTVADISIQNELYVKKELFLNDDGFILRGYIDRVQSGLNGKKIIIDIKTGKPPSSLDKEKADQIKSYALLYGDEDVDAGFVYFLGEKNIKAEKRILEVPIKNIGENEEFYISTYESIVRKSVQDTENFNNEVFKDVWNPKLNYLCNWCWYKNTCPEWVSIYQDKETADTLNKVYSKIRHSGGLSSKQNKHIKNEIDSIFNEISNNDLNLQSILDGLQKNELEELSKTIIVINYQKKETSTSVKALNKLKKLLIELSEQSFILENNKLLDTFIHPSQKDVVSVDTQQKPEQIWKIITKVLNNIQDEEIVSQLGDFKSEFDETIEDLRTDWLIWSEFIEVDKLKDIQIEKSVEEVMDFQFFRKNKIEIIKKETLTNFFDNQISKFSTLKDIKASDLNLPEDNSKQYIASIHKLGHEIIQLLMKMREIQESTNKYINKLASLEKELN